MSQNYGLSSFNAHTSNTKSHITREIAQSSYCLLCQFPTPSFPDSALKNACTDLHGAICVPENPYLLAFTETKGKTHDLINDNRDRTAQELGYANFNDGLRQNLQDAGFRINSNVSHETWTQARKILLSPSLSTPGTQTDHITSLIFEDINDCRASQPRAASLSELQAELVRDYSQRRASLMTYYQNSLPQFVENQISVRCMQLAKGTTAEQSNISPEWIAACRNLEDIRKASYSIYTTRESSNYEVNARRFLDQYFPTTPFYSLGGGDSTAHQNPETARAELRQALVDQCQNYNLSVSAAAAAVVSQYTLQVQRTRGYVESTISGIYSDQRRQIAETAFQALRADAQALVPQLTNDRAKQSQIIEEYNRMELQWMSPPGDEFYSEASRRSLERLSDFDPSNPDKYSKMAGLFSDPSMSYFQTTNAFYHPPHPGEDSHRHESVSLMPGLLNLIDSNPFAMAGILTHEIGHKLGPVVSKNNGHDISSAYVELLACYRSQDSIQLQEQQADEAVADYISSEVMAHQISKLPASQRRSAAMATISLICSFNDPPNAYGTHPQNRARINGIFASNPKIQDVMGCSTPQANFRQCSIDNLNLDSSLTDLAPQDSAPKSASDAEGVL